MVGGKLCGRTLAQLEELGDRMATSNPCKLPARRIEPRSVCRSLIYQRPAQIEEDPPEALQSFLYNACTSGMYRSHDTTQQQLKTINGVADRMLWTTTTCAC